MIDTPTVFIIGAGANKPYGFPTGKELRKLICYSDRFLEILETFPLAPLNNPYR